MRSPTWRGPSLWSHHRFSSIMEVPMPRKTILFWVSMLTHPMLAGIKPRRLVMLNTEVKRLVPSGITHTTCCYLIRNFRNANNHKTVLFQLYGIYPVACYPFNNLYVSVASRLFTQPFVQGVDQRKHQSSTSLAFRGIHRWPMNSPHRGPVTRKTVPFEDVIMKLTTSVFWAFVKAK